MQDIPHAIAADPGAHRPMVKADADKLDLVGLITYGVSTEMDVDAGTIGLGLVWATRRGRSPRSRWAAFVAHHATE
jgi:hypothetical protein